MLVFGLANRKSVAWHIGQVLAAAGAKVAYVVRTPERRRSVAKIVGDVAGVCLRCRVRRSDSQAARRLSRRESLASTGSSIRSRLPTMPRLRSPASPPAIPRNSLKRSFLRSVDISCYSLIAICNALKDLLDPDGSVVAISISTTRMASENYGYMAPIKAALDSSLVFLAKSFSRFSRIRFNAVAPGLLKTSASAGIPGYVDRIFTPNKSRSASGRSRPKKSPARPRFSSAQRQAASTPSTSSSMRACP